MIKRTSIFVEGLLQLANKHRLSGELIIVEWNPVPGPRLRDLLRLHTQTDCFPIRFIEVPPEIHTAFRNSDIIPLFQMIAKNVAIRRANGEFILATNPDLLFSDDLIAFLASGKLDRDVLYRIDRYDVEAEAPEEVTVEHQLAWCDRHLLRVHRKYGSVDLRVSRLKRLTMRLRTWYGRHKGRRGKAVVRSARHFARSSLRAMAKLFDPNIHTNGCGDFTLMAREHWLSLRGYPELPIWSMHVDSLLCYMAVSSGLREVVLRPPMKIFHLEHGKSWVAMSCEDRLRTFAVKPWIDIWLLEEIRWEMEQSKAPIRYNTDQWGLGQVELEEHVLGSMATGKEEPAMLPSGVRR